MVLALQEWRDWLEGERHPFVIWTDHKNLATLHSAHRLNSRQAHWDLFLGRLDFTLKYRPGSKHSKPGALSRLFTPDSDVPSPGPIILITQTVAAASWEVEEIVREALRSEAPPDNVPRNKLFVHVSFHSQVLGHSTKISSSGSAPHDVLHSTTVLVADHGKGRAGIHRPV